MFIVVTLLIRKVTVKPKSYKRIVIHICVQIAVIYEQSALMTPAHDIYLWLSLQDELILVV